MIISACNAPNLIVSAVLVLLQGHFTTHLPHMGSRMSESCQSRGLVGARNLLT